ncbi:MAG TPA: hypothetical protein VM307_15265 [Egibacteraceae bacterium]|nr:hypothetical protein [Egibacteraceae bacterium]
MQIRRVLSFAAVVALALAMLPNPAGAAAGVTYVTEDGVTKTDNVDVVAHIPYLGGSEVDSDGERYLFAGQAALTENLRRKSPVTAPDAQGGLRIIDLEGEVDPETGERVGQFEVVGHLDCPGTDNYVRYMDPEVFNTEEGDREFVAVAHHGNACTAQALRRDPHTAAGYGAQNGVMIVDVTDKTNPTIASVIGHYSAHTVMPHPTRPYLYILPGGLPTNGTSAPSRIAPTGIVDVSDPYNPRYVRSFQHNQSGCHDLGFSHDGDYAYCAGFQEVQVWQIDGDKIENPQVTGRIVNPAIMFAHNVVVSPSGKYIAINDEAFGFHTCTGEAADLYGSLWIYDISIPDAPVLAGRISPPGHPNPNHITGALDDVGPVQGWAQSWCAAHNYNWLPGTDDVIVASWFAGGITAHDMSNPMQPKLLAHYMPHDGVAWSGHYYAGYMVTNDMARGVEILDVPEVRALEGSVEDGETAARTSLALPLAQPRVDMSDLLIPKVLPPRPTPKRDLSEGGICVIPGSPLT